MYYKEELEESLSKDMSTKARTIFKVLNQSVRQGFFISPVNQELDWSRIQSEIIQNRDVAITLVEELGE